MQKNTHDLIIFLFAIAALAVIMISFIIIMLIIYNKKQAGFVQLLEKMKLDNEKALLNSQLEIQEQTFQHISREIHDNIGLLLTLAKLNLHSLDWQSEETIKEKLESTIELISSSIAQLSDISKSLNSEIIKRHGLLEAIDEEVSRIRKVRLFKLILNIEGTPIYLNSQKELLIFRIIQEAFNNIIKHSEATISGLNLFYLEDKIILTISDNGKGFDTTISGKNKAGLKNMETRIKVLQGEMTISSRPNKGTVLSFKIPII